VSKTITRDQLDQISKDRGKHFPVKAKYIGVTAINPFATSFSSPRMVMLSSQLSQHLNLTKAEERILTSGVDRRLAESTFEKKLDYDAHVLDVIDHANGDGCTIVFLNIEKNEVDIMEIPSSESYYKTFGFSYKLTKEFDKCVNAIGKTIVIPKGTVIANTPSQGDNYGYKFGVNANVVFAPVADTYDDAMIISESLSKRLSHKRYITQTFQFGGDTIPLNLYGNDSEYKIFPDIGEYIRDDGVLFGLRSFDPMLAPVLNTPKALREFDVNMDKITFFKYGKGKVINVEVYHKKKNKNTPYFLGTEDQVSKYANDMVNIGDRVQSAVSRYKKYNPNLSHTLTQYLTDHVIYKESYNSKRKIELRYKSVPINTWFITLTIEVENIAGIGYKLATLDGGKGIISSIRPDDEMPVDKSGRRADLIVHSKSVASRLNMGKLKEAAITASAVNCESIMREMLGDKKVYKLTDNEVNDIFSILLELTKIIGNAQYHGYLRTNIDERRAILKDTFKNRIQIYFPISNPKDDDQVIRELKESRFRVLKDKLTMTSHGVTKETKSDISIYTMYTILLNKTADSWLASNTSRTNHYKVPTSLSRGDKDTTPWSDTATKVFSESEIAAYAAYLPLETVAEMTDRTNNVATLTELTRNVLTADKPTNIETIVDRKKFKFDGNVVFSTLQHIFECSGVTMKYVSSTDDKLRKDYYSKVIETKTK